MYKEVSVVKRIILCLMALLSLVGCAANSYTDAPPTLGVMYSKYVLIGYDGGLQKIDDVGVVTTDGFAKIQSINGKSVKDFRLFKKNGIYPGGRYQLHLLPGTYEINMSFHADIGSGYIERSISNVLRVVAIKNGQIIHLSVIAKGNRWGVKESDGISAFSTINDDFNDLTLGKK